MNDDRVSELYLGEGNLALSASHKPCRARIDWMVSEVRGRTLDIGSSQGIVSILLGRAGHDVIGIEIEESIMYARRALTSEPVDVQQRVQFLRGDIYGDLLAGQQFDTVVLGEILEHHAAPRALWLRAAEFVAPGGRLVGTTPFGLHPHPDHKVTFYLRSFVDVIAGVGTLTSLDVEDGFIRFVVRTDDEAQANAVDTSADALLARSEAGFLALQLETEKVRAELKTRGERIATLYNRANALSQQLEQVRSDVATKRAELATQRAVIRQLESYTNLPDDAGTEMRVLSALLASLLREVNTGGLRNAPLNALRKTYARVRRAAARELNSGA